MTTYHATQLFDGQDMHRNVHMRVEGGLITDISAATESPSTADIQLKGIVAPGFIDLQVNGGGGVLFNYEQGLVALQQMMQGHAQFGTTAMLPTLITDSTQKMNLAANAISQAITESLPGIVGVHFEGPHLSLPKKGIHPGNHVRPVNDADLAVICRKDIGKVLVTLAPENVPTDVIADLVSQGVVVSLGHSGANIDCVLSAIDAGAHCFTHLFNAMSGLSARAPGMIAAALADPRVNAGIIADMHHVHPLNCQLAFHCMGADRLFLVTDAMAHVGCDMQSLPWLESSINKIGDKLTLDDGSLAGSCLNMAAAVKNMYRLLSSNEKHAEGRSKRMCDVLKMASHTPARVMSLEQRGQLMTGYHADFVLLNEELQIQGAWIGGVQAADSKMK
jgi:N-acetylglucosamine-6-phosphate deacetylase